MVVRYWCVTFILFATSIQTTSSELSIPEVVSKYELAMAKFAKYSAKSTDITTGAPNSGSTGFVERYESDSIRDFDDRLREKWTQSSEYLENGKITKSGQMSEVSIVGKDSIQVIWRSLKPTSEFNVIAKLGVVGGINTESGSSKRRCCLTLFGRIFFAYNIYNRYEIPFVEMFRDKSTVMQIDNLDGKSVILLKNKSQWGTATVFLDPTREYLPVRIVLAKSLDDWWLRDKPMSSFPPSNGNFEPADQTIVNTVETSDIDYGNGNAIGKAINIKTVFIQRFKNNEETKQTTISKVTDLVLNPDFRGGKVFEIQTLIPDGKRLQVDEEPSIVYEWRKGQVVKVRVNENYVAPIVVPGTPWWRWPLAVIVVVAVLFGLWRGSAVLRKG